MAIPSLIALVNTFTNNSFKTTPVANATIASYYYCNSRLGSTITGTGTVGTNFVADNENEGLAVAQFATSYLLNARLFSKFKTDQTIVPKTLEELWTPEIEELLMAPDVADEGLLDFSNTTITEDWEVN